MKTADQRKTRFENRTPLINRYEHNFFNGYVVAAHRAGKQYVKYFSDRPNGRREALRQAIAYRDWLLPQLPAPNRIHWRSSVNSSGVIGVALTRERTAKGTFIWRYGAGWPIKGGRKGRATFSVAKYGKREARRLAIEARKKGLAEYLASVTYLDYRPKPRSKHP